MTQDQYNLAISKATPEQKAKIEKAKASLEAVEKAQKDET